MSFVEKHRTTLNLEFRSAWEAAGGKAAGTWQEVFGNGSLTDDLFMAWQYASYIDHVAVAGKAKYPLPMYANAALIRPNYEPGQYNSGGPLPHSVDIWHATAPSLDFLSLDIYFNEFAQWASSHTRQGNSLFIPEALGGIISAANALYAFGHLSAIRFCPIGIDDEGNAPLDLVGITNPSVRPDNDAISFVYATLSRLAPMILETQANGGLTAALIEGEAQRFAKLNLGNYTANITRSGGTSSTGSRIAAMFFQTGPNEFLVAGVGDAQITFTSDKIGASIVGIESIDEQFFENGAWVTGRRLNGDEDSQGQALKLYATNLSQGRIYRVRLYRYR